MSRALGHSDLPLPCGKRRLSMGLFCHDYFSSSSIQTVYMGPSTGVHFSGTSTYVGKTGDLSTGSTVPHFTSSPPFSPTKKPLRSFLQQDVQPSNAAANTRHSRNGTRALHCCTSWSCSTYPAIPGAHATSFGSQIYFFPCRQQALAHLLTV